MPIKRFLIRTINTFRDTRAIDSAILWADLNADSSLALAHLNNSQAETIPPGQEQQL